MSILAKKILVMPFHKIYLLGFMILIFLLVFVVRSFLLWKRTGINPWALKNSYDAKGFIAIIFKTIGFIAFLSVTIYVFGGEWYEYLMPIWYLENQIIQNVGWVIIHLSLVCIFIAQLQMKDSWRIGIDEENKTELITNGLFQYSRNPIFLGVILSNLGLFMIIPNSGTLLVLVLSYFSIQIQIRLEEEFLQKQFGIEYSGYCKKVKRWI